MVEHQRRRLLAAMAEMLAEHGYATLTTTHLSEAANVSTSTFYKHFGNLWGCALAAYVMSADRLCEEIEDACAAADPREDPLTVGIEAALAFCAAEPQLAQLLCTQAPLEASAIASARRLLISRLAAMLRRGRVAEEAGPQPPGLDERLIDATLAFVFSRLSAGEAAPGRAHPRADRDPGSAATRGLNPGRQCPGPVDSLWLDRLAGVLTDDFEVAVEAPEDDKLALDFQRPLHVSLSQRKVFEGSEQLVGPGSRLGSVHCLENDWSAGDDLACAIAVGELLPNVRALGSLPLTTRSASFTVSL